MCDEGFNNSKKITLCLQIVSFTNLPNTASVSESVTTETSIQTLYLSPSGTYTCSIDDYSPTRADGNPFIIQMVTISKRFTVLLHFTCPPIS